MNPSRLLCLLFFISTAPLLPAQDPSADETAVVQVIKDLFDGMRAADSSSMRPLFHPSARLQTIYTSKAGEPVLKDATVQDWLNSVAAPHEEVYDEQIFTYRTEIDGRMATVWTEYTFYLGDQLSHCGVNALHLFNSDAGWKITQVRDTRRRSDCQQDPVRQINATMDAWHQAAAEANAEAFFGRMTADAIYLGTEAGERWYRDELREWSKDFFAREAAWIFRPTGRQIYFAADGNTAWFEEALATWMGPCRGSGVLTKVEDQWMIRHYNLAVTVPNSKIKDFIKLMEKE